MVIASLLIGLAVGATAVLTAVRPALLERRRQTQEVNQLERALAVAEGELEVERGSRDQRLAGARMDQQLQSVERVRQESYGALQTQVAALSERAGSLTNALRTPHVRGRWGEAQLRNVVEFAGMVEYCDYAAQATVSTDDGTLRPDLVVRIPGGKHVVVDAK